MTEAQWLACNDARKMRPSLRRRVSDRKLRLIACALFRAMQRHGWQPDKRNLRTLAAVERRPERAPPLDRVNSGGGWAACLQQHIYRDLGKILDITMLTSGEVPLAPQAALMRDIVGNPFRRGKPAPFLTPAVLSVAQAAYDERSPDGMLDAHRLAILADALEEAGCADADMLSHLRGPGPHVRGCWPVDLVLGNE